MLNRHKISRDLRKTRKLWSEQGVNSFFRKIAYFTVKKIFQSAAKRTLAKRDSLFKNIEMDTLTQDLENVFSTGLLRPLDEVRADVKLIPAEYMELTLNVARRVIKNEFTIYGNQTISYESGQFSWSYDPLTGFVWPKSLFDDPIRFRKPYGTDIKTIWEIARFQFLSSLAYAYIQTGEEQYVGFAIDKVETWIDENPFLYRPHWWMPMEGSIRLLNWCVYLPLMDAFRYADNSLKKKIAKSIFEHLIFIRENLEVSLFQANNHYLADLVGLLLAGQLFPSVDWAVESTEFALKEFEKEVQSQFKHSGINFEGSLAYHRLSFEMCLMGVALIKKSGLMVPPGVDERLKQMADFTKYYTSVSKSCPIIGDNDSGVYFKYFPGQEAHQHGYLNCLCDAVLENKSEPNNFVEFLCSIHFANTRYPDNAVNVKLKKESNAELQVREFDGLIIARKEHEALFFNTLQSTNGHTHNDKLAIYPVIGDELLFLDRGTFSYTGFWRKRHEDRMSASHNALVVNDREQNTIWQTDPFYNNGEAKCFSTIEHGRHMLKITGWHVGYERFGKGIKIFRRIKWDTQKRTFLISDWLEGNVRNTNFRFRWYFLINPSWTIERIDGGFVLADKSQKVRFEDVDRVGFNIVKGCYCPNYQVEESCEALSGSIKCIAGHRISFLLSY